MDASGDLHRLRRALASAMVLETTGAPTWTWPADATGPAGYIDAGPIAAGFVAAAERHHVVETLVRHTHALALPDAIAVPLQQRAETNAVASLRLMRSIHEVTDTLTSAGIDHLFFKGIALALQTTGDPLARGFGDIDVLVAPHQVRTAVTALTRSGWTLSTPLPLAEGSWADRYHRRTTYQTSLRRHEVDLDLHWRLDPAAHAFPGFDELLRRRVTVGIGPASTAGPELSTLDPLTTLQYACSNAAKDTARHLRALVDIHRMTRHPGLPADWRERLRGVDRLLIGLTEQTLDSATPPRSGVRIHPAFARLRLRTFSQYAERAQLSPEPVGETTRLTPLWLRATLDTTRSTTHPADLAIALAGATLQARDFVEVTDEHAATAVPKAIAARARRLAARFRRRRVNRRRAGTLR